jgi:hypothetical protein
MAQKVTSDLVDTCACPGQIEMSVFFSKLEMSVRQYGWGRGGGRARSPGSAAPDWRPRDGRSKPHRLFYRAGVSPLGS